MSKLIHVENLKLSLSGNPILKGVSFAVEKGESVAVVGPNGAGKTTLIKCLAGLLNPTAGRVRLDGRALRDHTGKDLAKRLAYVPQATDRDVALSVEEFVALGRYPHASALAPLSSADRAAVNDALLAADLTALRDRPLASLSGGERQMAFVAAALAQETPLLLLDEPVAFLDYRHAARVAALLAAVRRDRGVAVLAVHHNLDYALAGSDRVIALKDGRIFFDGTPERLAEPARLEALYGTAFRIVSAADRSAPLVVPETPLSGGGRRP